MKSFLIIINLIFVISIAVFRNNYTQEFNNPESAVYDPLGNRYFISNFGNGDIIQILENNEKSIFKSGLAKSLGLTLLNNILYVVENTNTVRGFNIINGFEKMKLIIDGAKFLNDIAADSSGYLYVTDSNNNRIIKIDPKANIYSVLLETEYSDPNGIMFDKIQNRLIFCHFSDKACIESFDLSNHSVTLLDSINLSNLDGVAIDSLGNIYVSSWDKGSFKEGFNHNGFILKYDPGFNQPPEIVYSGFYGPADIYYNKWKNEIVVPTLLGNKVFFINLK